MKKIKQDGIKEVSLSSRRHFSGCTVLSSNMLLTPPPSRCVFWPLALFFLELIAEDCSTPSEGHKEMFMSLETVCSVLSFLLLHCLPTNRSHFLPLKILPRHPTAPFQYNIQLQTCPDFTNTHCTWWSTFHIWTVGLTLAASIWRP